MTFGETYDHAMTIETQEEAEGLARGNLGYWAGYFDHATRERVERLFRCEHPVFGSVAEKGPPTPEEAFRLGVEWAKRSAFRSMLREAQEAERRRS